MPTSTSDIERPAGRIRRRALELGFDACAIADPAAVSEAGQRFLEFIELERHGDMAWLAAKKHRRKSPRALWPETGAVIMLAMNYGPKADPMADLAVPQKGVISCYAQSKDYHDVVKKRLKRLGRWIATEFSVQLKVFVDTAPVLEKPLAQAAGLGWQGKHSNLVSRDFGSWLFLGAIYTDLNLPFDDAHEDNCGHCQRCLDICPTAAFPAPYQLDARRCISYLTIEHLGHIDVEFRRPMGNRIFGCDDCLAVCPWNKFALAAREAALEPRSGLANPPLGELAGLDDAGFRQRFAGTPVKRLGRDRFIRNVLIAIANSGDGSLAARVRPHLDDASPLVRAMAVWALSQLLPAAEFSALRSAHAAGETDPAVAAEWSEKPLQ